jgi:hypothetical protein
MSREGSGGLAIDAGGGGNHFTIADAPSEVFNEAGAGNDLIDAQGTTTSTIGHLGINGGGADTITVLATTGPLTWGDGSAPLQSQPRNRPFLIGHYYKSAGTDAVRAIRTDGAGQSDFRGLTLAASPRGNA